MLTDAQCTTHPSSLVLWGENDVKLKTFTSPNPDKKDEPLIIQTESKYKVSLHTYCILTVGAAAGDSQRGHSSTIPPYFECQALSLITFPSGSPLRPRVPPVSHSDISDRLWLLLTAPRLHPPLITPVRHLVVRESGGTVKMTIHHRVRSAT